MAQKTVPFQSITMEKDAEEEEITEIKKNVSALYLLDRNEFIPSSDSQNPSQWTYCAAGWADDIRSMAEGNFISIQQTTNNHDLLFVVVLGIARTNIYRWAGRDWQRKERAIRGTESVDEIRNEKWDSSLIFWALFYDADSVMREELVRGGWVTNCYQNTTPCPDAFLKYLFQIGDLASSWSVFIYWPN
jgi:hypothetical protein